MPLLRGRETDWAYVDVRINGKAARLMVDTGASTCVLMAEAAAAYGYTATSTGDPLRLLGGAPVVLRQLVRGELTVGRVTSKSTSFQIVTAPDWWPWFKSDTPVPCVGLLGAPYLRAHSAVIDHAGGALHLRDPFEVERGLQGRWVCVGREFGGSPLPSHQYDRIRLRVRSQQAVFEDSAAEYPLALAVDPSASPKRMDVAAADGFTLPLICRLEGNRLTITGAIYQPRDWVGARPTEFRSAAGSPVSVMTFEREP